MRYSYIFIAFATIVPTVVFATPVVFNGGFELGLNGWQNIGGAQSYADLIAGVGPHTGTRMLWAPTATTSNATQSQMEQFLEIPIGSFDTLAGDDVQFGSIASQRVMVDAGNTLIFNWNCVTGGYSLSPDDFGFLMIGNNLTILSEASQATLPTILSLVRQTGWQTFSYTFPASGIYKVSFGSVDVDSGFFATHLLVDNVTIVPEPAPWMMLLSMIAILIHNRPAR